MRGKHSQTRKKRDIKRPSRDVHTTASSPSPTHPVHNRPAAQSRALYTPSPQSISHNVPQHQSMRSLPHFQRFFSSTPSDQSPSSSDDQQTNNTSPSPPPPNDDDDTPPLDPKLSQYKNAGWKKPIEHLNLSEDQKQERRERFALENAQRMNHALLKLRSTTGTIAYGGIMGNDSPDGALPQRNGSYDSRGATDIVQKAYEYRQAQLAKKQQKEAAEKQAKIAQEFSIDPKTTQTFDESIFGEFSSNNKPVKRELSEVERDNDRLNALLGKGWLSRFF